MSVLRRIPPTAYDTAFALAVLLIGAIELWSEPAFAGDRPLGLLFYAGFVAPFAVRRRWPLGALVVAWSCAALGSLLAASYFNIQTPFALVMFSAFVAGGIPALPRAVGGLLALFGGLSVVNLTYDAWVWGDFLFPGGFATAMWVGARTIRTRTLLAAELHEAAARAEEARELAAAEAVAEERRRIAREMHDLVGHSVSVMVVQAGGARRILDKDPARAVEAAERIEATGRAALAEMRRLLGLLGEGGEAAALAPQPTLDGLDALLARARDAGLEATLRTEGSRLALPAGAEVAVYRVVQEALTNALKHAGAARAEVVLRWESSALTVTVCDDGRSGDADAPLPGGGHGLVGMRERMRVYGGEIEAGPRGSGGYEVRARLPLSAREEVHAA